MNNGNDIALIRLPRPALTIEEDVNQIVQPVCLGWDNTIQVPDANYIVSGWGRTNNDLNDYQNDDSINIRVVSAGSQSYTLKINEVSVITLDQCIKDYSIFKDLSEKQICAGGFKGMYVHFFFHFISAVKIY